MESAEKSLRAERGRVLFALLESRTRRLRGDPPLFAVYGPDGFLAGMHGDIERALCRMRELGDGSSVRYRTGELLATRRRWTDSDEWAWRRILQRDGSRVVGALIIDDGDALWGDCGETVD